MNKQNIPYKKDLPVTSRPKMERIKGRLLEPHNQNRNKKVRLKIMMMVNWLIGEL